MLKLALLNTSIITSDGQYHLETISLDQAKWLIAENELDSAIGHQSTAEVMTTLLGVPVEMNRQMFVQAVDQQALVFKLDGRPAEGVVLSKDDIESMGYSFKLLTRVS